jgi:hypothetical protein
MLSKNIYLRFQTHIEANNKPPLRKTLNLQGQQQENASGQGSRHVNRIDRCVLKGGVYCVASILKTLPYQQTLFTTTTSSSSTILKPYRQWTSDIEASRCAGFV